MGCVSSTLLNQDEKFPQIGGSAAFSHHIVSLTSTTYGFLTLDNPPPPSPPQDPPTTAHSPPETINSWDLMSGLDSNDGPSFRYLTISSDENANPNLTDSSPSLNSFLEKFEMICPPNGENRAVLYTTSLRGVRKTFEDCEAVRSALRRLGIPVCERDISMDRGFREEMRELVKGKGSKALIPPRLFLKGRYIGGVEEVMKMVEEEGSSIGRLVEGLPKLAAAWGCEGCGGVGFLPCFTCHGSCKIVSEEFDLKQRRKKIKRGVVVKCSDCNENGLSLCPICS